MGIYNATLTAIDKEETKRYAGLKNINFNDDLINKACLEAQLLAQPKGSWEIYNYDAMNGCILTPAPFLINSSKVLKLFCYAEKVAVMTVTIGEEIENTITAEFKKGNYAFSLLLDAAATTAVEMLADNINNLIKITANKLGYNTTYRFSPGYGDWDIIVQPEILKLARANLINVTATNSCMLLPRKSVTAVIGFIPEKNTVAQASCTDCNQKICLARKGS